MKCRNCFGINAETDTHCVGCGRRLSRDDSSGTPAWAYFFAVACGLIPIVALGGCIPIALGVGGAGGCLKVSRATSVPVLLRMLGCIGITAACWVAFATLIAAVMSVTASL